MYALQFQNIFTHITYFMFLQTAGLQDKADISLFVIYNSLNNKSKKH